MKKALVLALVFTFGLGIAAFAGPLSGTWDTSISIDPSAVDFGDFFVSFSSTLAVDFTVGGWVFGSSSTFSAIGYSAQSFTAVGVLGAFSFDTTMKFIPMAVTATAYAVLTSTEMETLFGTTQTAPTNVLWTACPVFVGVNTTAPVFDDWTVSGSVSIAGVNFEGLFFLEGWGGGTTTTTMGYFYWSGSAYTQTGTTVVAAGNTGAGWRFKMSGDVAPGVTLTSYTYFNLSQADATSTVGCPVIGKKSTFSIASDDCDVTFTEEYITLEGLGFGCVTDIDLALKLTCDGFSYFKVVVGNIPFLSFVDLQFGITFSETSKVVTLCGSMDALGGDCFSIDVGLNTVSFSDATITSLEIYGISVAYTWNGISFSSDTSFNTTEHAIKGNIYGPDEIAFLVPLTGMTETTTCVDECITVVTVSDVCSIGAEGIGYYEFVCVPTEYYEVWETFGIESAGDACCGGAFDFSIDIYFGTRYVLDAYAWVYLCDGLVAEHVVMASTAYDAAADWASYGLFTYTTHDALWTGTHYTATAGAGTLFGWVETELAAEFGIASNFSINFGLGISVYGWESLDFGFELTF